MSKRNLAIYGAGYAGLHIFEELVKSNDINIVCFVDDNQELRSKEIGAIEILSPTEFDFKVKNLEIDELIISIPSAPSGSIKRIHDSYFEKIPSIKVLPSLKKILYDKPFTKQVKEFEFESLLDRSSKQFDPKDVIGFVKGKSIMITGGGGSIGSELASQCLKYGAGQILIVDSSEFNLYLIYENYTDQENVIPVLLDVTKKKSLREIFIKSIQFFVPTTLL